jgi:hypothetical protein
MEIVPLAAFAVTNSLNPSPSRSGASTLLGRHGKGTEHVPIETAPSLRKRLTTVTDAVFTAAEAPTVTVSGLGGTAVLGLGSTKGAVYTPSSEIVPIAGSTDHVVDAGDDRVNAF